MNDRIRRLYDMYLRVLAFMSANTNDFKDIAIVQTHVETLRSDAEKLAELGVDRVTNAAAAKDKTIHRGDARDLLRDAMQDVTDMWVSMVDEVGGDVNKFRMPRGSDQNLIDYSGSFEEELPALAAEFIKRGMPADFVADLSAKRAAFIAAVEASESAKRVKIGTTAGFEEPSRSARKMVEKLDPIVKRVFRQNPQKLAEWLVASHVERPPQSPTVPKT